MTTRTEYSSFNSTEDRPQALHVIGTHRIVVWFHRGAALMENDAYQPQTFLIVVEFIVWRDISPQKTS